MPEKIQIRCHYCGIEKGEYKRISNGSGGLDLTFKLREGNSKEITVWFCSAFHKDNWSHDNQSVDLL